MLPRRKILSGKWDCNLSLSSCQRWQKIFSSAEEIRLEKSHTVGKLYHLSRSEEYLKIAVTWQQPPGHQFKNDKDHFCSTMWTVGDWQIIMKKKRVYTCKTTQESWLGLQGIGEHGYWRRWQLTSLSSIFSSSVHFNILLSLLFNVPIRQLNDNKSMTLVGLPTCSGLAHLSGQLEH